LRPCDAIANPAPVARVWATKAKRPAGTAGTKALAVDA
jgi:hypothetical protein